MGVRVNDTTASVFRDPALEEAEGQGPYLESLYREGADDRGPAIGFRIVVHPQELMYAAMTGEPFVSVLSNNVEELRALRDDIDAAINALQGA